MRETSITALARGKGGSAAAVAPGAFTPPNGSMLPPAQSTLFQRLPQFCRVQVMATPSADSAIPIEVWMPMKGWNGKFRGQAMAVLRGASISLALLSP